jgi:hypothetical protein
MAAAVDGIPFWTEKMYPSGAGQDHLGLGSVVTDRILPRLSPSINVLTPHPRYFSFYAFVLSEFWRRDLPRTTSALRNWYRPMECIYSIACHLCKHPDHRGTAIGNRKISGLVANKPDDFDPLFDYMDSAMGGYGLYYSTVMESHGLVRLAEPRLGLPVDTVTSAGQEVAEAYRSSVSETRYFREWIGVTDARVPIDVVREFGKHGCYCRLREVAAPDRALLTDAFLHSGGSEEASARRETLRLFCELSAQTAEWPVNEESFRRLMYFRADHDGEGNPSAYFEVTADTLRPARRWRLYQAREYFSFGLNSMWRRLIEWGILNDGNTYPISMKEVVESLATIDFDGFARSLGMGAPGLSAKSPLASLIEWVSASALVTGKLDGPWELGAPMSEDRICRWLGYDVGNRRGGAEALAGTVTLLALIAARLWPAEMGLIEPEDWFPIVAGGAERISMEGFLRLMRSRAVDGATIGDVTRRVTLDWVIAQHERVAAAKLTTTGDTFRFRREAGRMRFFDKYLGVGMNDSRFNALATSVYELGWSGYMQEKDHLLGLEGEELRSKGDLPQRGLFTADAGIAG